jgi:glycosyltransferase involved in cell wall biosynthesis
MTEIESHINNAPTQKAAPVSVVISAYNAEAFLDEAILSVKAQTALPAEIIVVDDGSTDSTSEIARRHGVILIKQENRGVTAARNAGISAASQPWIALLDYDDLWEPRKLESQLDLASFDPSIHMVTCDYEIFDMQKTITPSALEKHNKTYKTLSRVKAGAWGSCAPQLEESFSEIMSLLLPSLMLVKRKLLMDIGMFDETLTFAEDFDCFMRALLHSKLGIVETQMAKYRIHSNNASHHVTRNLLIALRVTEKVIDNPHLYPQATVRLCTRWLPDNLRHAASRLLYDGRKKEARALLTRSLRIKLNAKTLATWTATWFPAKVSRNLLGMRYLVSKFGI